MKYITLIIVAAILLSCGNNHGRSVTANGHKLYYLEPVTQQEAEKVLSWLHEINHNFGMPEQPFQLSKMGEKYIFRYPVQNNTPEELDANMGYISTFREKLSSDALGNAKTDVILVDTDMKEIRKIQAP